MNYYKLQRSLTTHLFVGRYFKAGGTKKSGLYSQLVPQVFSKQAVVLVPRLFLQNINEVKTPMKYFLGDIFTFTIPR